MNTRRTPALTYLWRHHRIALIGFGLALAVALVFALRLTLFTIYWADPAHRQQPVAGWMTPGYIARSWEVPPEAIRAALPALPEAASRPTLAQIAEAAGIPLTELIAGIEAAIAGARTE